MLERYHHSLNTFAADRLGLRWPDRSTRVDAFLMAAVGVVAAVFGVWLFYQLNFDVMCRSIDVWLDSDPSRIITALHSRQDIVHTRSNIHPLWGIGVASFFILITEMGLADLQTMSASYVALSAFAFSATLFVALRLLGLKRIDSVLVSALCLSTSAAWFWLGIPELFALGGVSLIVPLIWMLVPRGLHDQWSAPLQSLVSVSITITNWTAGLLAALLALGLRRALHVALVAFAAAGFLAVIQYRFFPESGGFFNIWTEKWAEYGVTGTFFDHVRAFFLSPLAAPLPEMITLTADAPMAFGDRLSQMQRVGATGSPAGVAGLLLWGGLIALGVRHAIKGGVDTKVVTFVFGMAGFNFLLHTFYGIETFLYVLHFLPFLVIIAAWSLLASERRNLVRGAVLAAVAAGMIHNFALFGEVAAWYNALPPEAVLVDPDYFVPACGREA